MGFASQEAQTVLGLKSNRKEATTRVNVRYEKCDVYCGRDCAGFKNIGLGNPFKAGVAGNREQVIGKYKSWLWNRMRKEPQLRAQLIAMSGKRLGCWCSKDEACHVDVIEAAIAWLVKTNASV